MPVDLKHLSASTRDKVNKVLDAYADADAACLALVREGIRITATDDPTGREIIRVELFDPEPVVRDSEDDEPRFGVGLDIGPDEP